jgi:hypothetical protein
MQAANVRDEAGNVFDRAPPPREDGGYTPREREGGYAPRAPREGGYAPRAPREGGSYAPRQRRERPSHDDDM